MKQIEDLIPTTAHFHQQVSTLHSKMGDERNYPIDTDMPKQKLLEEYDQRIIRQWYLEWCHAHGGPHAEPVDALKQYVKAQHPLCVWHSMEVYQNDRERRIDVLARYTVRNPQVLVDEAALQQLQDMCTELREHLRAMDLYQQNGSRAYELRRGEIWMGEPEQLPGGPWVIGNWRTTGLTLRTVQERLALVVKEQYERSKN
jgi:hypothetical protein